VRTGSHPHGDNRQPSARAVRAAWYRPGPDPSRAVSPALRYCPGRPPGQPVPPYAQSSGEFWAGTACRLRKHVAAWR
jgi:hypothetical protein